MAKRSEHTDPKTAALLEDGTWNPAPEGVLDPKFRQGEFFDPRDLLQVRYEMLRRVSVDHVAVSDAASEYGVSRPTFYQARASFDAAGVAGLVPKKRGPRGPHKLHGDILAFIEQQVVAGEPLRARELSKLVSEKFSIAIHARTIERALGKKTPHRSPTRSSRKPQQECP